MRREGGCVHLAHRDVLPVASKGFDAHFDLVDGLDALDGGIAEVGPHKRPAPYGAAQLQGDPDGVACMAHNVRMGRGMLLQDDLHGIHGNDMYRIG